MKVYILLETNNEASPEDCIGTIRAFKTKESAEKAKGEDDEYSLWEVIEKELEE